MDKKIKANGATVDNFDAEKLSDDELDAVTGGTGETPETFYTPEAPIVANGSGDFWKGRSQGA